MTPKIAEIGCIVWFLKEKKEREEKKFVIDQLRRERETLTFTQKTKKIGPFFSPSSEFDVYFCNTTLKRFHANVFGENKTSFKSFN